MQPKEHERLRREILDDVAPLLFEQLAADEWGRVLVEVVHTADGQPVVAGIDVEEIVGDESRVDAAFGGDAARALLPMLARATEALCGLDGVELERVRGGTFVRADRRFAWIPGLVRTPSLQLDREREALVARLREKNDAIRGQFAADRIELDVPAQEMRWVSGEETLGRARVTLIGTFAHGPRTWAWASSNPSVTDAARRASAALTDSIGERGVWEISTPSFATDESTAWALAAFICDRSNGAGVERFAREDGALFVMLDGPARDPDPV